MSDGQRTAGLVVTAVIVDKLVVQKDARTQRRIFLALGNSLAVPPSAAGLYNNWLYSEFGAGITVSKFRRLSLDDDMRRRFTALLGMATPIAQVHSLAARQIVER